MGGFIWMFSPYGANFALGISLCRLHMRRTVTPLFQVKGAVLLYHDASFHVEGAAAVHTATAPSSTAIRNIHRGNWREVVLLYYVCAQP